MTLKELIDARKVLGVRLLTLFATSVASLSVTVNSNKIAYDLALGCAVSVFFFWLLVRWPAHEKRQRIKRTFEAQYRAFKVACIQIFLEVSDGSWRGDLPEELLSLKSFREYFQEDLGNRDNRWYRLYNEMDDYWLGALVARLTLLREEVAFLLQSVDASDEAMHFFKSLSAATYVHHRESADIESKKSFFGLLWALFAGWDQIYGYRDKGFVEEMIDAI